MLQVCACKEGEQKECMYYQRSPEEVEKHNKSALSRDEILDAPDGWEATSTIEDSLGSYCPTVKIPEMMDSTRLTRQREDLVRKADRLGFPVVGRSFYQVMNDVLDYTEGMIDLLAKMSENEKRK